MRLFPNHAYTPICDKKHANHALKLKSNEKDLLDSSISGGSGGISDCMWDMS